MNVIWVNKDEAEKIWEQVEPYLISALKRWIPAYFSTDLLAMVKKDEAQLWIITNNEEKKLYGAGLTQIIPYPRTKLLNLFLLGGRDRGKWKDILLNAMKMVAKAEYCEFIQIIGRRGWLRIPGAFESAVITTLLLE